jgi:hypothetical protein
MLYILTDSFQKLDVSAAVGLRGKVFKLGIMTQQHGKNSFGFNVNSINATLGKIITFNV